MAPQKQFMTQIPDQPPGPSSLAPAVNGTARSLLDMLTPADLPDLPPAHPDNFEDKDPPAPVS